MGATSVDVNVPITFDCGCDGAKGIPVPNFPDAAGFQKAIDDYWYAQPHTSPYGNVLNCWDVSQVTDMSFAFACLPTFNERLDCWDVSNVNDMAGMFYGAEAFNQPVGRWDISNVEDMTNMFYGAKAFNQNLCSWKYTAANLVYASLVFAGTSCDTTAEPKLSSSLPYAAPFCYLGACIGYRGSQCTASSQCNAGDCHYPRVSSGSGRICECSKKGACALIYGKCLIDEDCKGRTICSRGKCKEPKAGSRDSPCTANSQCNVGNCNYKGIGRICKCSKKGICVLKRGKCDETLRNADCEAGAICQKGICNITFKDYILPARCYR
jgi:hypothetical protein